MCVLLPRLSRSWVDADPISLSRKFAAAAETDSTVSAREPCIMNTEGENDGNEVC
jgi:hypothetical protein